MTDSSRQPTAPEVRRVASELLLDTAGSTPAIEQDDEQFRPFVRHLVELANDYHPIGTTRDTGDGVHAFFDDPIAAVDCAVALRREYYRYPWELKFPNLPSPLLPRIALHAGGYIDEGVKGLYGRAKIITKRLEGGVRPGEIWATEPFAVLLGDFRFLVHLGRKSFAKGYGAYPVYRVALGPDDGFAEPAGRDTVTAALGLLRSSDHHHQLAALDALGAMRSPRARRALERIAFDHGQPYANRRMALLSLEEHESPESIHPLIALINNTEDLPALRSLAVQALSVVRDDVRAYEELIDRIDGVTPRHGGRRAIALDLANRAVLGLRLWQSEGASHVIADLLEKPVEGIRVANLCVAAAAQEPDVQLMEQLSRLALGVNQTIQLRALALEALISVHRRAPEGATAAGADVSQEARVAELLDEDGSQLLRQLALVYVSDCDTRSSRERLSHILWDGADPLRSWALRLAARQRPPAIRLPERVGETRDVYAGLNETERRERETKERAGAARSGAFSTWPPARRPAS